MPEEIVFSELLPGKCKDCPHVWMGFKLLAKGVCHTCKICNLLEIVEVSYLEWRQ